MLCYQGTAFNTSAYNRSLPDLGIDVAHFSWDPLTIRWEQPFVITGTVFNAGWYTSTATTLVINVELTTGVYLEEDPFPLSINIPALPPNQTYVFSESIVMPYSPGPGYETLKFARLVVEVDDMHLIDETTEENNLISSPILIQPLPTQTGLYLVIRDDTYTVWPGGEGVYVNTGAAAIDGPGYSKEMEVTEYATTLADDLLIDAITTTYTIKWQGEGYRSADDVAIGVKRNASDPYLVDFSPDPPGNVAVMVTDRWGCAKGHHLSLRWGWRLAGAKVRLVGQGLSIETTTDTSGRYRPDDEPALGQMIPGDYQIRISAAGYARVIDTISIANLEQKAYNQSLNTTTVAYVHGNLINEFGNPVAGALVNACGVTRTTGSDGVFDMEVQASCTSLVASKTNYDTVTESMALTAGLEYLFPDWVMGFNPDMTVVSAGDKVASRIIDATTGGIAA